MRAIPQEACAEIENTDIKGIFHYEQPNTVVATPTTTAYNYTDSCYDEPLSSTVPVVAIDASGVGFTSHNEANVIMNSAGLYKWYMGPTTFKAEWDNPTLLQIANGNTSWTNTSHVVEVESNSRWVIVDIEMAINVPHPIHLHVCSSDPRNCSLYSRSNINFNRATTSSFSPRVMEATRRTQL